VNGTAVASTNDQDARADLISLLEFEIKRITEARKRPGWTMWALLAALGAMFWAGFSVLETSTSPVSQNVVYLFITLAISIDAAAFGREFLTSTKSKGSQNRFRFARDLFSVSRIAVTGAVLRYSILEYLLWHFSEVFDPVSRLCLQIFCAIVIILALVFIALSFASIPLQVSPEHGLISRSALLFLMGVLIAAFINLWRPVLSGRFQANVSEWKLAAICAATGLVLDLLCAPEKEFPLIDTFVDLRRKLALGEISVPAARRQFEIAIAGLAASDILQTHIEVVLRRFRSSTSVFQTVNAELEVLKDRFQKDVSISLTQKKTLVDAIRVSAKSRMEKAAAELDAVSAEYKVLCSKARLLRTSASARSDVERLMAKITDEMTRTRSESEQHNATFNELYAWLKKHLAESH
jgi:hypothetical protein